MDQLQKRSDGIYETPAGAFAIVPKHVSIVRGDTAVFQYKPSVQAETITVEWPRNSDFTIVEQDIALSLLHLGYAVNISDEMFEAYSEQYEAWSVEDKAAKAAAKAANKAKADEPEKAADAPPPPPPPPAPAAPEVPPTTPPAPPMNPADKVAAEKAATAAKGK